ncbi:phage tail protein [Paraburkholderia sp. ZP32-5]|uniref:phage tail protein n=1 Tax=Paraburkholderia sp. ZP32-5 TaxID=2883245 RepID=UPI001F25C5F5|nr:tail fiber protein [Paraburkholderia sp. ZP32-5]
MSDPYIGEIRMVGFSFAPYGWALCQGQIMQITQNQALFTLFGTVYGGNGQLTFGLPDLRGRSPVGTGTGVSPGLQPVNLGQVGGAETVTLEQTQMPMHTHTAQVAGASAAGGQIAIPASTATGSSAGANPTVATNVPAPTAVLGGALSAGHPATIYNTAAADTTLKPFDVSLTVSAPSIANSVTGGGQPFAVRNPYLGLNFIVALNGIYPTRD